MRLHLLLVLLASLMLGFVLAPDDSEAQTNPPTSGDWNIYDTTTISNRRVSLPGSVNVYSNGKLTLNNVDLEFTHASLGGKAFRVRSNAELIMSGGSVTHANSAYTYKFVIESGGDATLDDVVISRMWHNPSTLVGNLEGGLTIRSHTVTITDCTFQYNERVALVISNSNPTIKDTVFEKTGYYTYSRSTSWSTDNLYREAYGIVIIDGAPTISGCVFSDLGDYGTAFNDAGIYSSVYLRLQGHGIYSMRGAPTITGSEFTNIGQQPTGYSVRMFVPKVNRYVYFYFWNEDHRAAIRSIDPTILTVTGCNFTGNFIGYMYYQRMAYGIYQMDGKASIKNCIFLENGGTAIYAQDAEMFVQDVEMHDFTYYGLYLSGQGKVTAKHLTINGTAEARTPRNEYGIYLYRVGGNIDIRQLNITFCYRAIYVSDTAKVDIYDSYINNCTKKVYAQGSRVDLTNVTVQRAEVELGWSAAEVNIWWWLDVIVTWQNNIPVADAFIQIFNESEGLILAKYGGSDGVMPKTRIRQTKLFGSSNAHTSIINSPLKISAYAKTIHSELHSVTFESNTFFQCILTDNLPPNVEVYAPERDHAQNHTTLVLFGIAVDVGSGLDKVEISTDSGESWVLAFGNLTWNLSIDLEESVYDILLRGVDIAGGYDIITIKNVTIDLTKPWLKITQPTIPEDEVIYTNQTTVTIIGEVETGAQVYLNGEELPTQGGQFFTQISDQQEGHNTYEVIAVDLVGNRNITVLNIHQDITAPILLVEHPPEDYVTNDRVLDISGLTEEYVTVMVNGLDVEAEKGLFATPMTLEEGLNLVSIEAVDRAKNHKYVTLWVTYDVTPPEVDMTYPTEDSRVNHSIVVVSGKVDPDVSEVRVNQVPVIIRDGGFAKNFKLSTGSNLIMVDVTDLAGNSISLSYILVLDNDPPELELEGPEDGAFSTKDTIAVSGRVDVGATVTVNDVEVVVAGGYFLYMAPLEETPPGGEPNVLVIRAEDDVGNYVEETVQVYRDTQAPDFFIYGTSPRTSADFINITGTVVEPADVARLTINDIPVQPDRNGYYEAFVPLQMGENTFVVTAVDEAGNQVSKEVTIERAPLKVSDEGILGLGSASWMVLVLFLLIGVTGGMAGLYIIERRKEVLG
jgi:hypothetical protein